MQIVQRKKENNGERILMTLITQKELFDEILKHSTCKTYHTIGEKRATCLDKILEKFCTGYMQEQARRGR